MQTTLVAVAGISPAILTETLWALSEASPPVVPDEVVLITTSHGREVFSQQLLTPRPEWNEKSVWQTLREEILQKAHIDCPSLKLQLSFRVITVRDPFTGLRSDAQDLRSASDNAEASDLILQTLIPYTDAEDHHVIASIAGGRKTMGALLFSCMSLVGKCSDRVTHVLVQAPYETHRDFFYPSQPVQKLKSSSGKTLSAKDAQIELTDLPFVPLRHKFLALKEPRRSYAGLVREYSKSKPCDLVPLPCLTLHPHTGTLQVNGVEMSLRGRVFLVVFSLLEAALASPLQVQTSEQLLFSARKHLASLSPLVPISRSIRLQSLEVEDLSKALSQFRRQLLQSGLDVHLHRLAPKRAGYLMEVDPSSSIETVPIPEN